MIRWKTIEYKASESASISRLWTSRETLGPDNSRSRGRPRPTGLDDTVLIDGLVIARFSHAVFERMRKGGIDDDNPSPAASPAGLRGGAATGVT